MAQGTREFSLKNPAGKWAGIVDTSEILPQISGATFESIIGAYHNRDGTELRRWLGSKEVGRPFLGLLRRVYEVEADTPSAGTATVHVAHQWDQSESDDRFPHFGPGSTQGTFNVYIVDSAVIPDGIYAATWDDQFSFTITASASGSESAGAGTGRVFVQNIDSPQVLTHAGGRPVVIAETASYDTTGQTEKRNIGSWVASRRMDPADVLEPGYPQDTAGAELASDDGFIPWPSPTVEPHWEDWNTVVNGSDGLSGDELVYGMSLLRRMMADVLNRRVLIAVPGHGCMFEVNVAREDLPIQLADYSGEFSVETISDGDPYVPNHRFTKLLGIPRGHMISNTESGGSDCFFVASGFVDPVTGEVGLTSRTQQIDVDSNGTVQVTVMAPRAVLAESYGLDPILYISEPGEASVEVLFPFERIYLRDDEQVTIDLTAAQLETRSRITHGPVGPGGAPVPTPEVQVFPRRFPIIEQMPTGASWVRVVRRRMFSGGQIPSALKLAGGYGNDVLGEDVAATWFLIFYYGNNTVTLPFGFGDLLCDGYAVPSAYEGKRVVFHDTEINPNQPTTHGRFVASRMRSQISQSQLTPPINQEVNLFELEQRLQFDVVVDSDEQVNIYLLTDPQLVQVSEENFPGITPATNTLPVDTLDGKTPTGMARLGDQALVFTDRSTHLFQWGLLPRQATSTIISTQYGCIAPASAVEGPGFVTWLSHEGPMLYQGGALQRPWIFITDLWKTFVSESDGQMTNAQGIHDRERQLVIWQITRDHDDSTDDATKSKTTCSHLLVWNYAVLAFTLIRRPTNARPHCIGSIPINDSANSKFFWAPAFVAPVSESAYYPIHFMDERYSDREDDPNTFTANADRGSGSDVFATASAVSGVGEFDEAFIRGPGGVLRWWGRIASTSGSDITLDDSGTAAPETTDGADWKSGDVLENQVIHVQISTNYMRVGELGRLCNVRGVNLRLESFKRSDATYTSYSWARVRVEREDGKIVTLSKNEWGDPVTDGIVRFPGGFLGAKHFKLHVDIISNVQMRVQDITVEAEPQA